MTKMKKAGMMILVILVLLLGGCAIYLFTGSSMNQTNHQMEQGDKDTKTLVVYFSREGEIPGDVDAISAATKNSNKEMSGSDTKAAAKMVQKATGADLYQIKTKKYYRKAFMGTAAKAWIEEKLDQRPELLGLPKNLDKYDTIYVGYPIWWFNPPMAVGSFLESYDLSGKTVIPFCTSQDNDIDVSMDYIKKVSKGANLLDGKRIHEASQEEVTQWVNEIKATTEAKKADNNSKTSKKTLVVYYSATGSTKDVAEMIADDANADLFEIEPKDPYTDADLDWTDDNSRVSKEHENENKRNVELKTTKVKNWDSYDKVLVGYPIWWGIAAWPVDNFIKDNDFTGKTVIPFCTSASSGLGDSGELLEKMAGTGTWKEGQRFQSGADRSEVTEWVDGLNLK